MTIMLESQVGANVSHERDDLTLNTLVSYAEDEKIKDQ